MSINKPYSAPQSMLPYGKQDINDDDIAAVVEVLKSDFITQGPKVPEFEQAIAHHCNNEKALQTPFAVAVNSATSALHIACLALEVGKGDSVWTSPISFVASANCALYCGATIDFVDIDITTGNMSCQALREKLILAKETNRLPKVVIVVHLAGQSCDMQTIKALSDEYQFAIIEDASHAVGGSYHQHKIGSCQFSDITVFSFHPVKIITSAEGGMALTNNVGLANKMRSLRSHGITNAPEHMTEESHGPWYYQQITLGFNYRMTELQAALGINQIKRLDEFVARRNEIAENYHKAFDKTNLTSLTPNSDTYSAYHLYIILLPKYEQDKQKVSQKAQHKAMITALRKRNICAHVHYIPIHLQPYYQDDKHGLAFKEGDFPVAEQYYNRAISLPLYPQLSKDEQAYIIDTVLNELASLEKNA